MSNIDKQWLRQLAVDAKELAIIKRYTKGIEAQKKFIAAMTPALVLALLDELEGKDKLIADYHELISGLVGISSSILREVERINNSAAAGKGE